MEVKQVEDVQVEDKRWRRRNEEVDSDERKWRRKRSRVRWRRKTFVDKERRRRRRRKKEEKEEYVDKSPSTWFEPQYC